MPQAFNRPWHGSETGFLLFLLLFLFATSIKDQHHLSRNGDKRTMKNYGHKYEMPFQQCRMKFYQRKVCELTEFESNRTANERRTKEKATRYNSNKFRESKLEKHLHLGAREKAQSLKVKHDGEQEVFYTQNNNENLEEYDKLCKTDLESQTESLSDEVCPYLRVRAKKAAIEDDSTCKTTQLNESECEFVNNFLGKPHEIPPRSCPQSKTSKTLCWFGKGFRTSSEDLAELRCDVRICRDNVVYLGVFDTKIGQVMPDDDWLRLANGNALVEAIRDVMRKDYSNHFSFCFLRCNLKDHPTSNTKQIVIFPPIVHPCPNTFPPRININIIVQDSTSRPHFYRFLPKTVNSLREIVQNPSIHATVLDFEKYQSYDSSTHSNIKKLFAGRNKNGNFTDVSTTITELYKKFRKASYRSLFQEDACWFEGFGSLLRPSFLKEPSKDDTQSLWERFYEFLEGNLMPNVDSFGVGFTSCNILQDLGDTNIFNGEALPLLCFDGRPFSYYYLNAVQNFLDANKYNSCPVFSYLHLNTGHEHTGQRITQDDEYLASFVRTMATHHRTTLTILLSDHGSKTTDFATRTVHGLKEIYKPFMFLIIPRDAAEILGNDRMRNLIRNQKRLVALEDLSLALSEIASGFDENKAENTKQNDAKGISNSRGLFGEISADRKCSELNLSADAICQCEGEDVETVLDPLFLDFLASIAVGGVNNMIQSQYDAAGWNGRCRRYVLKRVERVRSKVIGNERITTFSVVVNSVPVTQDREEIFETSLRHHLTKRNDIELMKVTRLSRYDVFKTCADVSVQLDLCTCEHNSNPDPKKYILELLGYYMFQKPSAIEKLEFSCLYLITTKQERFLKSGKGRDAFLAYEIINTCHRIFNVTLLDRSLVRKPFILSSPLPFSIVVYPYAVHYVMSAFCRVPEGEFVASFKVDLYKAD